MEDKYQKNAMLILNSLPDFLKICGKCTSLIGTRSLADYRPPCHAQRDIKVSDFFIFIKQLNIILTCFMQLFC